MWPNQIDAGAGGPGPGTQAPVREGGAVRRDVRGHRAHVGGMLRAACVPRRAACAPCLSKQSMNVLIAEGLYGI